MKRSIVSGIGFQQKMDARVRLERSCQRTAVSPRRVHLP